MPIVSGFRLTLEPRLQRSTAHSRVGCDVLAIQVTQCFLLFGVPMARRNKRPECIENEWLDEELVVNGGGNCTSALGGFTIITCFS